KYHGDGEWPKHAGFSSQTGRCSITSGLTQTTKNKHLMPAATSSSRSIYDFVGMGSGILVGYNYRTASKTLHCDHVGYLVTRNHDGFRGSSSQLSIEPRTGTTVGWMRTLGPKTVLCVDDEAIGLRVRKIMLESHGFTVLTANNGQQALALFDQHE